MAGNENLEYIKEGLNTQEQILGQAIAGERFIKKHKVSIFAIIIIAVCAVVFFGAKNFMEQKNTEQNNALYTKLLADPENSALINELENKNINLFALFAIKEFSENNNTELINRALSKVTDSDLKEILLATKGENSKLLENYDLLLAGFKALKNGDTAQAKIEFSKIPENSKLKSLSKSLEHYQVIKEGSKQ